MRCLSDDKNAPQFIFLTKMLEKLKCSSWSIPAFGRDLIARNNSQFLWCALLIYFRVSLFFVFSKFSPLLHFACMCLPQDSGHFTPFNWSSKNFCDFFSPFYPLSLVQNSSSFSEHMNQWNPSNRQKFIHMVWKEI